MVFYGTAALTVYKGGWDPPEDALVQGSAIRSRSGRYRFQLAEATTIRNPFLLRWLPSDKRDPLHMPTPTSKRSPPLILRKKLY
jgi:hypothetical protein